MQKIVTNLWFEDKAEEAAQFYTSLFEDAHIIETTYYGEAGSKVAGRPVGSVLGVEFSLCGQHFIGLNGEPVFPFSPAFSLMINCETQEEVDRLWERFTEEGQEIECGWVTDKYGLSWQVVPVELTTLVNSPDPVLAERATAIMLKMKKLDVNELKRQLEIE